MDVATFAWMVNKQRGMDYFLRGLRPEEAGDFWGNTYSKKSAGLRIVES